MEKEEDEVFSSPEKFEEKHEEKIKLGLMRNIVENQDPTAKEIDDLTLRRFLRARDLDVDKASTMFIKYLKWRQTFVPETGFISPSQIKNQIAQNKLFVSRGIDKSGRPIVILFGARHFSLKGGLDEFKRFVVFFLDKLCSRIPDGQEKFTIIGDLEGYGYSNIDVRGYLAALTILQDYYPERLGKMFIIHSPYIFLKVWKIVYPFMDKNTRNKIVFVESNGQKSTLLEEIGENELPEIYGGKSQLIPIQDC